MRTVLLTGAGGAAAIGVARCLRMAAADLITTVGCDSDPYLLQRAETDHLALVPRALDPAYIPALNALIAEHGVDFVHAQNDTEVAVLSEHRAELRARTLLPRHEVVQACQDKWVSYGIWREAGLRVPETFLATGRAAEDQAWLEVLDGELWLRPRRGAGGRGALRTWGRDVAVQWLHDHHGWTAYTVAQALTPRSTTWMSLWYEGSLQVAQGRERLTWEGNSESGVTGSTGVGLTISDPVVDEIAERAIRAIDPSPHGLYGVDLTYDQAGVPNPTEINIGRCFTSIEFFAALGTLGWNVPFEYVQLGITGLNVRRKPSRNPCEPGWLWIRGMDREPVLVSEGAVQAYREQLAARLAPVPAARA